MDGREGDETPMALLIRKRRALPSFAMEKKCSSAPWIPSASPVNTPPMEIRIELSGTGDNGVGGGDIYPLSFRRLYRHSPRNVLKPILKLVSLGY